MKTSNVNPLLSEAISGSETSVASHSLYSRQFELEDKYAIDPDRERIDGARVMHPNRNVDKKAEHTRTEKQKRSGVKSRGPAYKQGAATTLVLEDLSANLSREFLSTLESHEAKECITIYMPTHRSGVEVNEQTDPIQLRTLIQQAESEMKNRLDNDTVIRMVAPAYALSRSDDFWSDVTEGLALFIARDFCRFVRLPSAPEKQLLVNSSFLLSPLIPYVVNDRHFFVLSISKKRARLFRADNFHMQYIHLDEMPDGMEDVIHFEEKDDQTLFRTGSSGAGGGANYHGIGGGKPDEKENISLYLAEVDNTIRQEVLHGQQVPLVVAGVEYLTSIFRKVTKYNAVWPQVITGNREHESDQDLYTAARAVMEPYFCEKTEKALQQYGNRSATELTMSLSEDIIPAAYHGRVSHLFVRKNEELWGTFQENKAKVIIHASRRDNDESLLDKAIVKTILNGGEAHILDADKMPAGSKIAALLRY